MSGGYGTLTDLVPDLASFRQYPPERNILDGTCWVCGDELPAGAGRTLLGGRGGRVWAVLLCTACAAEAGRMQKMVTCTCHAIFGDEQGLRNHCKSLPVTHRRARMNGA